MNWLNEAPHCNACGAQWKWCRCDRDTYRPGKVDRVEQDENGVLHITYIPDKDDNENSCRSS